MESRITFEKARKQLIVTWLTGSSIPLIILSIQTFLGKKYDGVESQVWSWICPLLFPVITLMLGTLASTDSEGADFKTVNLFFLRILLILSWIYLLIISLVIILEPYSTDNVLIVFSKSNYFIIPINSLITACIGSLFTGAKMATKNG